MLNIKNNFDSEILAKIHKLKHANFGEVVLKCNFNDMQYALLLLTFDCTNDTSLMERLAKWRKQHERWFPAQFKVTIEGTTLWFQHKVIEAPDRLLFMIKVQDEYIGHVGLFRFDLEKGTCEIDNIVRGEMKYHGIMGDAIINMMRWGVSNLNLENYSLQTTSDNERALKLYHRLGFSEIKRIPLKCVKKEGKVEWVEAPKDYNQKTERYNIIMALSRNIIIEREK